MWFRVLERPRNWRCGIRACVVTGIAQRELNRGRSVPVNPSSVPVMCTVAESTKFDMARVLFCIYKQQLDLSNVESIFACFITFGDETAKRKKWHVPRASVFGRVLQWT